ncbi:MAG: hypothetical protein LQ339_007701 [Xanthoria mediterranea]|nr:MAG: hypothetical protein LQ339_007701 [Xanthoria mediterranea]
MPGPYDDCVDVTDFCVVEATTYGYRPSLGASSFFIAIFAACMGIQFFQGMRWRTWFYMSAMTLGCLGEVVGYAGRVIMHGNPWDDIGFQMQICCLIIAPSFFAAAIYLTLKHLVLTFGPEHSRLPPKWYTWIFIGCDLFSLILQGAGGGVAASASDQSTQDTGSNLMLAGIVWQVVTLIVFAALAGDFVLRVSRARSSLTLAASDLLKDMKFRLFVVGLVTAYLTITIRCIYRIAELAGGWGNDIMQNEAEFIVLEGVVVVIAVICQTAFHPGYCFPQMRIQGRGSSKGILGDKDASDPEMTHTSV